MCRSVVCSLSMIKWATLQGWKCKIAWGNLIINNRAVLIITAMNFSFNWKIIEDFKFSSCFATFYRHCGSFITLCMPLITFCKPFVPFCKGFSDIVALLSCSASLLSRSARVCWVAEAFCVNWGVFDRGKHQGLNRKIKSSIKNLN